MQKEWKWKPWLEGRLKVNKQSKSWGEGRKKACGERLKGNKRSKSLGEGRKQTCGGGQVSNKRPYSRTDLNERMEGEWMELSGCSKWLSSLWHRQWGHVRLIVRTSSSRTLIPFYRKSLEGGDKWNKFIEKELGLRALTKRVIWFKKVCNISETIFDKKKSGNGCKEGRKKWEPIPSRRVLWTRKWERINDHPLHTNLKIVVFQIKHDFLENSGIIQVEKKHNPINSQEFSCEIKNGYYPIFLLFVPEGDLWELGVTEGTRINNNKVHLVLKIDLHTSGKR